MDEKNLELVFLRIVNEGSSIALKFDDPNEACDVAKIVEEHSIYPVKCYVEIIDLEIGVAEDDHE